MKRRLMVIGGGCLLIGGISLAHLITLKNGTKFETNGLKSQGNANQLSAKNRDKVIDVVNDLEDQITALEEKYGTKN